MLGETSSRKRPENSLLEKDLDYQRTVKVAPTITEDVTQSIEDMIKQRIRDELWDDVERKMEDKDFKPNRELDEVSTEKSKLGLGDLYAQEYEENVLGNKSTKDIEQQKLYDEITGICCSGFMTSMRSASPGVSSENKCLPSFGSTNSSS